MDERQRCAQQLEEAVERMDLDAIGALLDRMDALETDAIATEDPALFAARIRMLAQERESIMKHRNHKILLIAACLAAALSVGVYASGVWTHFDINQNGRLVTVTTTDGSMTRQEAQEMAAESADEKSISAQEAEAAGGKVVKLESKDYKSVAEAAAALNIPAVIPKDTAGLSVASVSGQDSIFGKTLWVIFGEEGRRLGVTVIFDQPSQDGTVVSYSDIEGEMLPSYKSAKGDTFTRIRDEHGDYAVVRTGNYQYVVIFENFSEQEIHRVLDSTDLSLYR